MVLYHKPPPGAAEAKREAAHASGMAEHRADDARLRAEHVAFSFMKRGVQPLMAQDTLGYQYTGDEDTSRMPGNEVDDEDIVERLGRILKDMLSYTLAQSPSTPRLVCQTRLLIVTSSPEY
jgi:hypothetical protein